MSLFEVTAGLVAGGYATVALWCVHLLRTRPHMLRGRQVSLVSFAVMAIPWIIFYGSGLVGVLDFTATWRTLARVFHFINIGVLMLAVWSIAQYEKRYGEQDEL